MSAGRIERRIFVVGVPRSGTTLVQSFLAAHSDVASFTESHFFSRYFKPLPALRSAVLVRDPAPRLREFLAENEVASFGMAGVRAAAPFAFARETERRRSRERPRVVLPFRTRPVARQLLGALDALAAAQDRSSWVEKTPRHLRFVPFLERLAQDPEDPGARPRCFFVHVIREGLDTVASLHRASASWEHPYDLETCVQRWNADVGFSRARVGKPSDQFVFYEELTTRPEATLKRLIEGLELGWEAEILTRYRKSSEQLITAEEPWKKGVSGDLRRSRKSLRDLTKDERARVDRLLNYDLYTELLEARV